MKTSCTSRGSNILFLAWVRLTHAKIAEILVATKIIRSETLTMTMKPDQSLKEF